MLTGILKTSAVLATVAAVACLLNPSGAIAQCDPAQIAKLLAADGFPGDSLGAAVAISGNTAILGAYRDDDHGLSSGSAYLFADVGNGLWIQIDKITALDGAADDYYGQAVAVSHDTAVVGAFRDDDNGESSGSAYVYQDDGHGQWNEIDKLTALDGQTGDYLGFAVAISGNTAIIGAYGDGQNGILSGSACVFRDDGQGAWDQIDRITASDAAAVDFFGYALAMSGDTAIIGAWGDDDRGSDSGAAYLYRDNGNGQWIEIDKITASDGAVDDSFGFSVAISGDIAVVGAPFDDGAGSAYVFQDDGNGHWIQIEKLIAPDRQPVDKFGASVAVSGDTAVIGAWGDDDHGDSSGSAYLFRDNGSGHWVQIAKITSADAAPGDHMGIAVAIDGDTALTGADGDDDMGDASGSTCVFDLGCMPALTRLGACPGPMRFRVSRATPNRRVAYLYARGTGSQRIPDPNPCAGTPLGLDNTTRLADVVRADINATATLDIPNVPNAACGHVYVQAIDLSTCTTTNVIPIQ